MSANMTDATDHVRLRVSNPELIPAERYYDAEFFALEQEKLWPHVWQMACRLEEIPNVGDWTEYRNLNKSVIVVRSKGGVKAFLNACRHRGVQLADGHGNCAKTGFICPFHGWRFNLDGDCTFVFGKEIFNPELLDAGEIDLVAVRIEFWAGCAFINFDDHAPSLLETLGPVAPNLDARNVDKLRMDWWYATELPVNWKLAMEAFMEGYHVMRTHPQLHELSPGSQFGVDAAGMVPNRNFTAAEAVDLGIAFYKNLSEGMAGMVHETEIAVIERLRGMEVPDDPLMAFGTFVARAREEITRDGLARGAPMFDLPKVTEDFVMHDVEFMFPHFFLLPSFAAMASYRIRPLTPESCYFEIWSLVLRPADEPFDTPKQATFLAYDSKDYPEIPMQDYSNLPLQQKGLHNFKEMRLSNQYEGMISNYQRLVDGFLAGLPIEQLAKSTAAVNSGYNAPILDIGF